MESTIPKVRKTNLSLYQQPTEHPLPSLVQTESFFVNDQCITLPGGATTTASCRWNEGYPRWDCGIKFLIAGLLF